jgi:hypothetical protein
MPRVKAPPPFYIFSHPPPFKEGKIGKTSPPTPPTLKGFTSKTLGGIPPHPQMPDLFTPFMRREWLISLLWGVGQKSVRGVASIGRVGGKKDTG